MCDNASDVPGLAEFVRRMEDETRRERAELEAEMSPAAPPRKVLLRPTPTRNPARPRTTEAGFELDGVSHTGTFWVRFRDGALWEWMDVPREIWEAYPGTHSTTYYMNKVLNVYENGPADFSTIEPDAPIQQ